MIFESMSARIGDSHLVRSDAAKLTAGILPREMNPIFVSQLAAIYLFSSGATPVLLRLSGMPRSPSRRVPQDALQRSRSIPRRTGRSCRFVRQSGESERDRQGSLRSVADS